MGGQGDGVKFGAYPKLIYNPKSALLQGSYKQLSFPELKLNLANLPNFLSNLPNLPKLSYLANSVKIKNPLNASKF